jgi:hypothetical protein
MKLLKRAPGKWVFRLSRRDREALQTTLWLRTVLARTPRSISSDTITTDTLRSAQEDLDQALQEHRQELARTVDELLKDPNRCAVADNGTCDLTLTSDDMETLLQALNEVRVGAWEKLGQPNFDEGEVPEPDADNLHAYWALQLTDAFQGLLLMALSDED